MKPPPEYQTAAAEPEAEVAAASEKKEYLGHMDFARLGEKRVSWDELKAKLASKSNREEGVPGEKNFDAYSEKLEKERNERLQAQELDTKSTLKRMAAAGGAAQKKYKKDKKSKKEKKGPKRTADGAVLAGSSDDESPDEDCLLARYKKQAGGQ